MLIILPQYLSWSAQFFLSIYPEVQISLVPVTNHSANKQISRRPSAWHDCPVIAWTTMQNTKGKRDILTYLVQPCGSSNGGTANERCGKTRQQQHTHNKEHCRPHFGSWNTENKGLLCIQKQLCLRFHTIVLCNSHPFLWTFPESPKTYLVWLVIPGIWNMRTRKPECTFCKSGRLFVAVGLLWFFILNNLFLWTRGDISRTYLLYISIISPQVIRINIDR